MYLVKEAYLLLDDDSLVVCVGSFEPAVAIGPTSLDIPACFDFCRCLNAFSRPLWPTLLRPFACFSLAVVVDCLYLLLLLVLQCPVRLLEAMASQIRSKISLSISMTLSLNRSGLMPTGQSE